MVKMIEDKRSIEEKMYGHLPYWKLFSQHQGDYLNDNDWLKIVSIIENGIIDKARFNLQKKEASNFCSCYEGDLYDKYEEGVNEFLEELSLK